MSGFDSTCVQWRAAEAEVVSDDRLIGLVGLYDLLSLGMILNCRTYIHSTRDRIVADGGSWLIEC